MTRRTFVAAAMAACTALPADAPAIPIIDCHIHLFDQTRPQGAPYSGGGNNTQPALPARYKRLAEPLGIVGAIEIEASPWIEDNLWVLEVERKDPIMLGTIGNLQPDKPEFKKYLDRFHKNKLFLGIRYGNLWGYSLVDQVSNPKFIEGLQLMQDADLALDTANQSPDLLKAVVRITDKVPQLRIIVDHLPNLLFELDSHAKSNLEGTMRELAKRPHVYIKVSEVIRMTNQKPSLDPAIYKPTLDYLYETFGEDRLLFGSDWPNGAAMDQLPAILQIVRNYFASKGRAGSEKYFWKNSVAAYKWTKREARQPSKGDVK
jgi:L-fuconolactonase